MDISKLYGVCTALVTPFRNGEVHWDMLKRLVARQLDSGVKALVLSGTTGEAPTLTDVEKRKLIEEVKKMTGDDCIILAGTGTNSTVQSIKLSIDAQSAGADGLLVVSPYYNKGNPDGVYRHFKTIAESVELPAFMYNVPSRTGYDVPVSVYKRLADIPNIIGVKEASSDITKIGRIRNQCGNNFRIWSGNDDQVVPVISMGGVGVISVLSNLFPEETVDMVHAALSGDYEKASAIQCSFMPLIEALFSEVNPIPLKYAMKCIGYDCGDCRLPLGSLSISYKRKMKTLIK